MALVPLSDGKQYRGHDDVKVGDRVTVSGYQGAGVVRFVGGINAQRAHGVAAPSNLSLKPRVGVELDNPVGANNGVAGDGQRYFKCPEMHGVFVVGKRVKLLAHGERRASSSPNDFGFQASEPTNDNDSDGYLHMPAATTEHQGIPTRPGNLGFDTGIFEDDASDDTDIEI